MLTRSPICSTRGSENGKTVDSSVAIGLASLSSPDPDQATWKKFPTATPPSEGGVACSDTSRSLPILLLAAACSRGGGSSATDGAALLQAGANGANWLVPGKSYSGNRLTTLTQIDPSNVGTFKEGVGYRG